MTGYCVGDLVELRTNAERGIVTVFEVARIRGGGELQLRPRGGDGYIAAVVAPGDVAEEVFPVRPEVLHVLRGEK